MYRIISASKDTYIQNKFIASSRSIDANVGQAGSLDLYKLYNETVIPGLTGTIIELSRILIKFDYDKIEALTGSVLDFSDSSFNCALKLKDVYGGQTTPSNFTLELFPLSKSFDEGRGFDVVAYRDIDATNWITASLSPTVTWSQEGAAASGSLGEDIDIIKSGNLGAGVVGLGITQRFNRGDEDLNLDVTSLVSASLAGILQNHGFRISFISSEEEDEATRFVKRFGTRHSFNKTLRPELIIKYDDRISDPGSEVFFETSQSLFIYNSPNGIHKNFFSGSTELTGNNVILLQLITSKSITSTTTSFSPSHSASITHTTRSVLFFSRSFTGNQHTINNIAQIGVYSAPFSLSVVEDSELSLFVSNSIEVPFNAFWKSIDGSIQFGRNSIKFKRPTGDFSNAMQSNLVINMTNLRDEYNSNEVERVRVFAADYNQDTPSFKVPTVLRSVIVPDMRWRIIKAFTREVVIPWNEATRMSTDQDGMYFDMFFDDLHANEVYEFEILAVNSASRDQTITNKGFRFKVIP